MENIATKHAHGVWPLGYIYFTYVQNGSMVRKENKIVWLKLRERVKCVKNSNVSYRDTLLP